MKKLFFILVVMLLLPSFSQIFANTYTTTRGRICAVPIDSTDYYNCGVPESSYGNRCGYNANDSADYAYSESVQSCGDPIPLAPWMGFPGMCYENCKAKYGFTGGRTLNSLSCIDPDTLSCNYGSYSCNFQSQDLISVVRYPVACSISGGTSTGTFSVVINPAIRSINVGETTTYTMVVSGTGIINLSKSCPVGTTCSLGATSFDMSLAGMQSTTLTVTGNAVGNYSNNITVTGTSGSESYSASATLIVNALPTCTSAGPTGFTTTAITGTHDVFAYGVSSNVIAVKFPTWGDPGGQDDLVWYPGINMGGGTWKASIDLSRHKVGNPEYGNINVDVYMDTTTKQNVLCSTDPTFYRGLPPPVMSAPVCNATGDKVTLSWVKISGVDGFANRLDDTTNDATICNPISWLCDPSIEYAETLPNTVVTKTYSIKPNHLYDWWIHAIDPQNNLGSANHIAFTCGSVIPVPTVSFVGTNPSPVQVPSTISLSWNVSGDATSCTASGGSGADGWSGIKPWTNGLHTENNIPITGTTNYSISCKNASGSSMPDNFFVTASPSDKTVTVTPTVGGVVKTLNPVTGIPDGFISCPPNTNCSHTYSKFSVIKLSAIPSSVNWKFVGWVTTPSVCVGDADCAFSINSNTSVKAIFIPRPVDYREF